MLLFPKTPASFGWQWTDMNMKLHVRKAVYSAYTVCVRKSSNTFFQGMNTNENKKI